MGTQLKSCFTCPLMPGHGMEAAAIPGAHSCCQVPSSTEVQPGRHMLPLAALSLRAGVATPPCSAAGAAAPAI